MELTIGQRQELTAIRLEGQGAAYRRDTRPMSKEAYRDKRKRLQALRAAWDAIDHDTRVQMLIAIARMWSDETPLPDLAPVIDDIMDGMELPDHRPEDIPGLGRATFLLWSAWCAGRPGGEVAIDREAREAIGAEVAALFGTTTPEAERRVTNVLRALDKNCELPARNGYGS